MEELSLIAFVFLFFQTSFVVARESADKASFSLFFDFFKKCLVRRDISPSRVLERLRTCLVHHVVFQFCNGIL